MTSRERILCAMSLGTPDRVPVSPHTLGRLDPNGKTAAELIKKADPIIPVGLGGNVFLGGRAEFSVVTRGNETVTTLHTPGGDLTQRYRRTDITGCVVEFFCKGPEDVEKLLNIPFEPVLPNPSEFRHWSGRLGQEGLVLGDIGNAMCFPATVLSPEDMCLLWADVPELVLELVRVGSERINAFVEEACRMGVDGFRIVGGEYATEQLGPKGFAALVKPFDTELVKIIHDHGAVAYYHNHGNVSRFLEDLADLGIDALDPLEMPPYGDTDLADAKRRIGDRVCLVGPLDDMEILEKEDEETCKALARKCIEAAGPDGYILGGTASGTYTEKAARNFMALVDVAEEYRRC